MTSERLAEIERWVHDPDFYFATCDDDSEYMAIRDLLAEVERLRAALAAAEAREAALLAVVRAVAQFDSNRDSIGAFWLLQEQARAVLASTTAEAGEQAASKTQGEA